MLLIAEKGIRGGICNFINIYVKANEYMKNYDINKESSYIKYWGINDLYGWTMSQKLPVNGFKWVKGLSEFSKGFIKSFNEKNKEGYFLEVDIQYLFTQCSKRCTLFT